jgi:peptidoglycan-N-acetylglucosamine deacetylase
MLGILALVLLLSAVLLGGAGARPHHRSVRRGPSAAGTRRRVRSRRRSVAASESAGIDRTLAYTPYVRVAGAEHREIALTFDDGPGPYTPKVISILERYRAPATFFEVGALEPYFHSSTRRIIALGDPIGDHTFYHAPMGRLTPADQQAELLEGAQALERYGAPFPRLFRPPYGLWNSHTLALLHAYRMLMVLWTVDTNDYLLPGWGAIVRAALKGAKPGAIILLHDGGGNRSETVSALPRIITKLRARGYRLVTVPQLLTDNPPPPDQNVYSVPSGGG